MDRRDLLKGIGALGTVGVPSTSLFGRLLAGAGEGIAPKPELAPSPYATDFRRFLYECVHTIDRAQAGKVRPWPTGADWDEYWSVWIEALATRSLLLVDKTRRTMASNIVCAWDLWIASGGVDRRWEALEGSTDNRLVLIQGRKLQDEMGSEEFVDRISAMYRYAMDAGLAQKWPGFPEWTFGVGWGKSNRGGVIRAVPQGADQVRGPGTTLLHMEEISFWEQAQETIGNAIPALYPSGHLVAVTTPAVASYARDLREGKAGRVARPTPDAT